MPVKKEVKKEVTRNYGHFFMALLVIFGINAASVSASGVSTSDTAPSPSLPQRIETYLNQLKTVDATFHQTNARGIQSTGRFYMWRPGLMRLEYNLPSQELIIADGTYITHIQKDLNEVSSIAIDSTPASILLTDHVSLAKDTKILSLERKYGKVFLTVVREDDQDSGQLTLVFNEDPLLLLEWIVEDPDGRLTHVILDNIKTGVLLPKSLFIVKDTY